jgi:putative FmdB family regulatory protein
MPIYEYQCKECAARFDIRRNFNDEAPAYCPKCGAGASRLFTPVPIIFNGSGFYITDNKRNGTGTDKQKATAVQQEKADKD